MSCSTGTCNVGPAWLRWTLRVLCLALYVLFVWWCVRDKSLLEILGILAFGCVMWALNNWLTGSLQCSAERVRTPAGPDTRAVCARCGGDMTGREDGRTCPRCGAMYGVDHVDRDHAVA